MIYIDTWNKKLKLFESFKKRQEYFDDILE